MGDFAVQDGQTILFIGDSITDCGRRGAEGPLGSGYVKLVSEMTTVRYPERSIQFINKGIGGNRITDLKERWQDDVIVHKPDWLSIKIGINDMHSDLRSAPDPVTPERYDQLYDEILTETREKLGCPVLIISPFYISRDRDRNTHRSRVHDFLPEYIDIATRMSEKYGTRFIRTHDIFQTHLQYRDADHFCPEPVHPHHTGHLVIASAVMEALTD